MKADGLPEHNRWLQHGARVALLGLATAAGCTTWGPSTEFDAATDFSRFETYTWIQDGPVVAYEIENPLGADVEARLLTAAREGLEARGLRFVASPQDADLVVAFTISTHRGEFITEFPTIDFTRPRSREWHSDISIETPYLDGRLEVKLIEAPTARPVWRGSVTRRVTPDHRADPGGALERAVKRILERYPPG